MFLAKQMSAARMFQSASVPTDGVAAKTSRKPSLLSKGRGPHQENYEEILVQARLRLEEFINLLGNLSFQPLDLTQYQLDFPGENVFDLIDLDNIKAAMDSSIRKMKSNKKIKTNWSRDDMLILLWVIEHYNKLNGKSCQQYGTWDWQRVGSLVPGKNGEQAMFKWLSLKSNRMPEKRDWEPWQDECLSRLVRENHEKKWFKISKELYLQTENEQKRYRSAKQCRQRWTCYLNPTLKKGNWSAEEDYILFGQFLKIGKKWSAITKHLRGRTQNAVKNRWKLVVEKFQRHRKGSISLRDYLQDYLRTLELEMNKSTKTSKATSTRAIDVEDTEVSTSFGGKPKSHFSQTSTGSYPDEQSIIPQLGPILELPAIDHFPMGSEFQESDFTSLQWSLKGRDGLTSFDYNLSSVADMEHEEDEEQSLAYFITEDQRHNSAPYEHYL